MTTSKVSFAKALADETRQQIMRLCCCEWISVNDIVSKMDVAQPTVSHHLAILREAGLVSVREQGRQTFYTLNQEKVVDCCGQLMTAFAPEQKATLHLIKLVDEA
ncbi:MAG: metalloregulator ArsR/SmtB family transcription factor [Chloroflexi bacterium]|nr:metalloregulator ArsR/SmtB family transcription factor [Chloroflexota bacterium]